MVSEEDEEEEEEEEEEDDDDEVVAGAGELFIWFAGSRLLSMDEDIDIGGEDGVACTGAGSDFCTGSRSRSATGSGSGGSSTTIIGLNDM